LKTFGRPERNSNGITGFAARKRKNRTNIELVQKVMLSPPPAIGEQGVDKQVISIL
jgi:hypothetical protein